MYGGARHHDLGHTRLPGSLNHLVQVSAELFVGEVCSNVNNDVVGQFVKHGLLRRLLRLKSH